jgi:hypothetical protein
MAAIPLSRSPAWWLRSTISLALALAILVVALPVAFGEGSWGGGVDPSQFFSANSRTSARPAELRLRLRHGPNAP